MLRKTRLWVKSAKRNAVRFRRDEGIPPYGRGQHPAAISSGVRANHIRPYPATPIISSISAIVSGGTLAALKERPSRALAVT